MKVIGLTGGIASGKSLVSDWFRKVHIKVIDADSVYKNLLKVDNNLYNEVTNAFNLEKNENNRLDFKLLARIVFNDKSKLELLNKITHPYVIKKIEEMITEYKQKGEDIIILAVPLLFEAKMEYLCDKIICVYLDRETQIERLLNRSNLDREVALKRIESQMDLNQKKAKADYVIDNSYSRDNSYLQFIQILAKIKNLD
ncbi:MAG: dephospho-CoA kinase [Candidatus Izemoplasmatales bacterium]